MELFRGLDLEVQAGEMVAIVGESGAGKSSLLHLLAALDTAYGGRGLVWGERLSGFTRAAGGGVSEPGGGVCVAVSLSAAGVYGGGECGDAAAGSRDGARRRRWRRRGFGWARWAGGREENRSGELSGGEQQRVSLARALVTEPKVLLADEPTGDLDGKTAEAVFGLIQRLHKAHGLTSVLVTHNLEFAERCDRMLRLREGRLEESLVQ